MSNEKKENFYRIQKLVRNEVLAGLRILPEKEFRSRLEDRLAEGKKRKRFPNSFLKPVPLLAGTLVVFFVTLIGVFVIGKKPDSLPEENSIAGFLEKTPGVQTLALWGELNRLRSKADRFSLPSPPDRFIGLFRRVEEDVSLKTHELQLLDLPQYPALDYRQMLEILFKKKAVHQFLIQLSEKKEEEKNG